MKRMATTISSAAFRRAARGLLVSHPTSTRARFERQNLGTRTRTLNHERRIRDGGTVRSVPVYGARELGSSFPAYESMTILRFGTLRMGEGHGSLTGVH